MKKKHGRYMVRFGIFHAVELYLLWMYWVVTDGWPPFIEGRPIDGVIAPLVGIIVASLFFGSMIADIAKD